MGNFFAVPLGIGGLDGGVDGADFALDSAGFFICWRGRKISRPYRRRLRSHAYHHASPPSRNFYAKIQNHFIDCAVFMFKGRFRGFAIHRS